MIKEFQQLRNQITKVLIENQALKKELVSANALHQKNNTIPLILDLIQLIEKLEVSKDTTEEISKREMIDELLTIIQKYGVEQRSQEEKVVSGNISGPSKKQYLYYGELLEI